jgi:predicted regulator of Ras-like GTPase activity (Roadblock/LC7/MglB family)
MKLSVVASWVETPLKHFVDDARVEVAVLMHASGQVLGQYGFARSIDVMTACALASAIHASSSELGRQLEGKPFAALHYTGRDRQIFLGAIAAPGSTLLLLAVFDRESSLGLVQLYLEEFKTRIAAVAPPAALAGDATPALAENFERDLNRNLAQLFGRA